MGGGVSFTKHDASARAQAITQLLYVTSFVFTLLTSPRIIETTKLRNLPYIAKSYGRILSVKHTLSGCIAQLSPLRRANEAFRGKTKCLSERAITFSLLACPSDKSNRSNSELSI